MLYMIFFRKFDIDELKSLFNNVVYISAMVL